MDSCPNILGSGIVGTHAYAFVCIYLCVCVIIGLVVGFLCNLLKNNEIVSKIDKILAACVCRWYVQAQIQGRGAMGVN